MFIFWGLKLEFASCDLADFTPDILGNDHIVYQLGNDLSDKTHAYQHHST